MISERMLSVLMKEHHESVGGICADTKKKAVSLYEKQPLIHLLGELNPCCRDENPVS